MMRGATCAAAGTRPLATACLARVALVMLLPASAGSGDLHAAARQAEGTGTIRGHVTVSRTTLPAVRPRVSDLAVPRERDAPDRRRAVVYLESAPRGAFDAPATGRATLDQRNETFFPHVLAITAGTTVDFPNSDDFYHNVFSLSRTKRFDLGRYAAGRSKSVRFDDPGIVRVFCEIHSHMNAFILVFAHPFFSVTDDGGDYRIDDVPSGTYRVVAWYEGSITGTRPVRVTPAATAELDFSVP